VDDGLHLRLARVDDPESGEVGATVLEFFFFSEK
jgi:hypothetical protein